MTAAEADRPVKMADPLGMFDSELLRLSNFSEELVHLMDGFFQQRDQRTGSELLAIASDIAQMRTELRHLSPNQMGEAFPVVGAEMDAITRDTEVATNTILSAAEAMMDLDGSDPDIKDKVDDLVMRIFEACSFQDLVGQRVSKVVRVVERIEERIGRLGEMNACGDAVAPVDAAEKRRRDLILNGPAIGGPETSQAQVDAFFN